MWQAGRAGLPPWRIEGAFGAASDEGSPNAGDDSLTARVGLLLLRFSPLFFLSAIKSSAVCHHLAMCLAK